MPDFIPALNKKGHFSAPKVRRELALFKQQKKERIFDIIFTIGAFVVLGAEAILVFWVLFFSRPAAAAGFTNYGNGLWSQQQLVAHWTGPTDYWHDELDFTTTTDQVEILDVSLLTQYVGTSATRPTVGLTISSDLGSWSASATIAQAGTEVTTTWNFPYPHPAGTTGKPFHFVFSGQNNMAANTYVLDHTVHATAGDQISGWKSVRTGSPTFTYSTTTYGEPLISINSSGTGFATVTLPPSAANYGLTGTSSAQTQDLGFLGNMLRDVGAYLFTPDPRYLTYYDGAKADIQTRVPFAYFSNSLSLIETVSSTATTTALTATIPTMWGNIPLFDSDDIKDNADWMNVVNGILFWERIFLWLSLLFWIFDRLRYIEL